MDIGLNARREVHEQDGPLLLLAGPGTGKTYRLGMRIKYLVEERGVDPGSITVITFTAASAANMRDRISDPGKPDIYLQHRSRPRNISTMHSLGYRIVRENTGLLGFTAAPDVVAADHTRSSLLGDAAQLCGEERKAAKEPHMCRQLGRCEKNASSKCLICEKYRQILAACGAIDYDDQILLSCELLRTHAEVAERYRQQARHLLIDEYQDINAGQFELIRLLTQGQVSGLFAVGDDDQSIYSFRGGSPAFIRNFARDFGPTARVEPLLVSRRCPEPILEGALAVVKTFDPERLTKGHFEYKAEGAEKIVIHAVPSDAREAEAVRRIVEEAIPQADVLVLVPTRAHAGLIAMQLRRARVPFAAAEPSPGDGLPIISRLAEWLGDHTDSLALRDCIQAHLESPSSGVPSKKSRKEEKLRAREAAFLSVSRLWDSVLHQRNTLWASLSNYQGEELLGQLRGLFSDLAGHDRRDVPAFLRATASGLALWSKTDALLEEIQTWISRAARAGDTGVKVRIMTMPGAKGLEADVVCVVGLEAGTLPRKGAKAQELAEMARLLFVSMTRAKRTLHLFHVRKRSGAVSLQTPDHAGGQHSLRRSEFVDAIPKTWREDRFRRA